MKKRKYSVAVILFLSLAVLLTGCYSEEKSEDKKDSSSLTTQQSVTHDKYQIDESRKKTKGLPKDADHAKTDKIYATGNTKVYYVSHGAGNFVAQISDFKGYTQEKVKAVLGNPQSVSLDQNYIQTNFKEKEKENIAALANAGKITEEQARAFLACAIDLALATKFGNSDYFLYSYQDSKIQLIFTGDGYLYYMTPDPQYLYFK